MTVTWKCLPVLISGLLKLSAGEQRTSQLLHFLLQLLNYYFVITLELATLLDCRFPATLLFS